MEITPPELKQMTEEQLEQRALEITARLPEIRQTEYFAEWGFTEETYELNCISCTADVRRSYNGDLLDHMRLGDEAAEEIHDENEILERIISIVESSGV